MRVIKNGAKKRFTIYVIFAICFGFLIATLSNGIAGYSIAFNTSNSLNGKVYLINTNDKRVEKGTLIAFVAPKTKYYPNYNRFIKYTWGVAGDEVSFKEDGTFLINGKVKGVAKSMTKAYEPLEHAEAGLIPKGKFFVGTPHKDSFDSRYKLIGNIDEKNIIGRAYLLF